jgi:hypothetical protein
MSDTTDIVERPADWCCQGCPNGEHLYDCPIRIDQLVADNGRLREALEKVRSELSGPNPAVTAAWIVAHQILGPTPWEASDE